MTTPRNGKLIVLTASAAEMAYYGYDAFKAFSCTFPHRLVNRYLKKHMKPVLNADGSSKFAPYGLRKVEAMLAEEFGNENVVIAHPENIEDFVGPDTKMIGINSMDPMGLAYVSTTYNSLIGFGGESVDAHQFKKMIGKINAIKQNAKIVLGGAGGWQVRDTGNQEKLGIDHIVAGETDDSLIPLVKNIIDWKEKSDYIKMRRPDYDKITTIQKPATYGSIEITRGCGRGCAFCSPTMRTKHSFPIPHIMEEVKTNIDGGNNMVFIITEDVFLYDSHPGFKPNRQSIVNLFKSIAGYPGVDTINLSHASFAPVLHDKKILPELTPVLIEKTQRKLRGKKYIPVEIGIESGSARLMKQLMAGKSLPFPIENWQEVVKQGVAHLNDNSWYPLCTIMTGIPGETEQDTIKTLELIDDLAAQNSKMFYTPVLFIPLEEALLSKENKIDLDHLTDLQWEVIINSWKNNIKVWRARRRFDMLPYKAAAFMLYWTYMRWKHGKNATRPMMKFVGLPEWMVSRKVGKKCDAGYCKDDFQKSVR